MAVEPKEHIAALSKISRIFEHKLKLVYSSDDEGNNFQEVHYTPAVGHFDGHTFEPMTAENKATLEVNALCIN